MPFIVEGIEFPSDRIADTATYDNPCQFPVGIPYVIVNGVAVVAEGEMTDERSGQFVKGTGAN